MYVYVQRVLFYDYGRDERRGWGREGGEKEGRVKEGKVKEGGE